MGMKSIDKLPRAKDNNTFYEESFSIHSVHENYDLLNIANFPGNSNEDIEVVFDGYDINWQSTKGQGQ